MGRLNHADLERFVTDVLSKREPCPAMVLAWGWALKQGEGGIFHNDTFKQRYFVLARVPHATVLIYYGQKCMDEDHILGYIDLRRVTSVRETTKMVVMDNNKSPASAMINRFKGLVGVAPPAEGTPRPVIELVTSSRTFVLSAATIVMPQPMTTSMAVGADVITKPLYLFGWPFPVPPMDEEADEEAVAAAVAQGTINSDAFAQWRDVMATAVAAEKATRVFPVMTLVDSSAQLPQRVLLRTTPCELAVISVEDKDMCFTAIPYNDLLKWEVPLETELHVTARTRSRLVARPDRSGFNAQRPTRRTCHYVFKSTAARAIVGVIDNHLRALAKQLGAVGEGGGFGDDGGAGATGDDGYGAAADAYEQSGAAGGAGYGDDEEEDSKAASKKLTARRAPAYDEAAAAPSAGAGEGSDDEDGGHAPAPAPAPARTASSSSAGSSKKKAAAADSDSDSDAAARKRPSSKKAAASSSSSSSGGGSKKKHHGSDDEEEDEAAAAAAAAAEEKKKKKAAAASDSEDDSKHKHKSSSSSSSHKSKKKADSDDEDEDSEKESRQKKHHSSSKKKAAASDSEGDDSDDSAAKAKAAKAKAKAKAKAAASDSE